jgi:hypothetical protein
VSAEGPDFEKTMIIRPGALKPSDLMPPPMPDMAGLSTATTPAAPIAPVPLLGALQILSGGNAGREVELTKNLTTLGKPGAQVAVITRRPQGYFVTHVEGTQFPIVNGTTIAAQPHPLGDHDVLEIAGVQMEFFLKS